MILFLMLTLVLSSCTMKNLPKVNPLSSSTMNVGGIALHPHQVKPLHYLKMHPEQKGLLLAHYLGTGKTYSSLAYAETYDPHAKVIIIVPEFLKASWFTHMSQMSLLHPKRYHVFSYEEAAKELNPEHLQESLLIIDEIHHLISLIKSFDKNIRTQFVKLYNHLSLAKHILALSGTPIFTDLSDLSYILNLVSGEELLPYNNREFADKYTKINKTRSFWRGHITESHLLIFGLPFVLAAIPLAFITPTVGVVSGIYFGGIGTGFLTFPVINSMIPLNRFPLRTFDASKLKDIASKYVSFFDFNMNQEQSKLYPQKNIFKKDVSYNQHQIELLLNFADMSLSKEEIARLGKSYNIDNINAIESMAIQHELRSIAFSGREIGNFHFTNDNNDIIESPKFEEIYKIMGKNPQGVVIYSSYFANGILLFADFLKRKGLEEGVAILHKDASIEEQIKTINSYNQGKTKILLLHPSFTEGISLEMTKQLHILEPLDSQAKYEQVMGRVVRLNSHARLDKSLRKVNIYEWASTLSGIKSVLNKNNNWAQRFSELNSIASFGNGQSEIDPNHFYKKMSPDEYAREQRYLINNAMTTLKDLFSTYSIEREIK